METASSISSAHGGATILQGNGLAQQQQLDAACLVYKSLAGPNFKHLNDSPTAGGDLVIQQQQVSSA